MGINSLMDVLELLTVRVNLKKPTAKAMIGMGMWLTPGGKIVVNGITLNVYQKVISYIIVQQVEAGLIIYYEKAPLWKFVYFVKLS